MSENLEYWRKGFDFYESYFKARKIPENITTYGTCGESNLIILISYLKSKKTKVFV